MDAVVACRLLVISDTAKVTFQPLTRFRSLA